MLGSVKSVEVIKKLILWPIHHLTITRIQCCITLPATSHKISNTKQTHRNLVKSNKTNSDKEERKHLFVKLTLNTVLGGRKDLKVKVCSKSAMHSCSKAHLFERSLVRIFEQVGLRKVDLRTTALTRAALFF